MKRLTSFLPLLFIPLFSFAQLNENLESFHKLSLFGNMKVRLVKGDESRIELPRDDSYPERFKIKVEDGKLSLRLMDKIKDWEAPTKVIITYTELDEIWVHAGAYLYADEPLLAEEIKMEGTMGAVIELDIEAKRLETYVTEGAEVTLGGSVNTQRIKVTTGGQYYGYQLDVNQIEARTNTGGEAEVRVADSLKASARTGGAVYYRGNPGEVELSPGVSGTIEGH